MAESEAKYRILFENMEETVTLRRLALDEQGQVVDMVLIDANPAALKAWGIGSIDEVRGKKYTETFSMEQATWALDQVRKMRAAGMPVTEERRFDYNRRHYLATTAPCGKDHVITTSVDITERKGVEEALKKNFAVLAMSQNVAHLGSWSLDFETGRFEVSDEIYRIYGLELGSEASLNILWTLIHPDDLQRYREYVESIQRDGHLGGIDYRILRSDGSGRYLHAITENVVRGS